MNTLSLILFVPPNIVPWILISSLIFHLISTNRLINSNLMPPVPKFWKFLLTMKSFIGFTIALMMVFNLFRVIYERKETQHQRRSLPLEEMINSLILFP